MKPLIYLNYPLDKKRLLDEALEAKKFAKSYGDDPRYPGQTLDTWLISKHESPYAMEIIKDFEIEGKPRFYFLESNAKLPEHTDNNTTCSINFILSDGAAPVSFKNIEYFYTQALLNTTLLHSVSNGPIERILFKISIFNESFEKLANRIKFKL